MYSDGNSIINSLKWSYRQAQRQTENLYEREILDWNWGGWAKQNSNVDDDEEEDDDDDNNNNVVER